MTSVWTMFAKPSDDGRAAEADFSEACADGEFTVAAPAALPAHVAEFLDLKAANSF